MVTRIGWKISPTGLLSGLCKDGAIVGRKVMRTQRRQRRFAALLAHRQEDI